MKKAVLYIHGKGGDALEALRYKPFFAGYEVIGLDYAAQTPWEAARELPRLFDALCSGFDGVELIANSIGAYFAMHALSDQPIERAYFISPIVDMERLILDMLGWIGEREETLREAGELETVFGETLSWEYLCYVREHPIRWRVPTHILYGGIDTMTSRETVTAFAERVHATLTVMEDGEHWFHTDEQLDYLDRWLTRCRNAGSAG